MGHALQHEAIVADGLLPEYKNSADDLCWLDPAFIGGKSELGHVDAYPAKTDFGCRDFGIRKIVEKLNEQSNGEAIAIGCRNSVVFQHTNFVLAVMQLHLQTGTEGKAGELTWGHHWITIVMGKTQWFCCVFVAIPCGVLPFRSG